MAPVVWKSDLLSVLWIVGLHPTRPGGISIGDLQNPEPEHTEEVVRLRERDPQWVAPLLWRSELLNVLWKVVRHGGLTREEAILLMGEADGLLESVGHRVPDGLVLSLAIDSGCTAYDCHYVALAQELGIPLLTHDRQVLSAFPGVAVHPADYLGHRARETDDPSL